MNSVKSAPTPRQQKAALTRTRMLSAAYDLFCENGFRATTMDAIAQRAGVAVQTLYFTFHTKDQLVQAVHDRTVLGEDAIPPQQQPWLLAAAARANVSHAVHDIALGIATILARVPRPRAGDAPDLGARTRLDPGAVVLVGDARDSFRAVRPTRSVEPMAMTA